MLKDTPNRELRDLGEMVKSMAAADFPTIKLVELSKEEEPSKVGRESRVTFQNLLKITYVICASKSSANTRKAPLKVFALHRNTPVKYT